MPITCSKRSFLDSEKDTRPAGPKVRAKPKGVTVCLEGQIVVSTSGATSIYTGGFAGCLGLVIATPDNHGGLVAHVKQMGKKPNIEQTDQDYMTAWCGIIVERAIAELHSEKLYVALYKGIVNGIEWTLGFAQDKRVIDVLDLRATSHSAVETSELLFDTKKKKLYIPSGLSPEQRDSAAEVADSMTRIGELTNNLASRAMPLFRVP